jgi:hypothetical protein
LDISPYGLTFSELDATGVEWGESDVIPFERLIL